MKQKCFNIIEVIVIMIVTSIVAGITTGVITINNAKMNLGNITKDEDLKNFVDVYEILLSKYYDNIDKKAMLNAAEEGMLNFLGDRYTSYLEDSEYQDILDELAATYKGIGIEIKGNYIVSVVKDSPAEKAGIMAGDYLSKVNSIDITGMDTDQISALIKGDKSASVTLEIKRNDETYNFVVKKETIANKTIRYQVIENTNIGYIYIKNFSENLAEQVSNALKELEKSGIDSLIIDVRDDSGGYLESAEETASLFLEEGKIIYSLESTNGNKVLKDSTKEKRNYPIAVLIDNNSASASEILAAALKDSYGATLIGTTSFGKGKVQEVIQLDNGDSVKTTSAKWLTPSGVCIDGVGITPDYIVMYTPTGLYGDTQLEKAILVLQG